MAVELNSESLALLVADVLEDASFVFADPDPGAELSGDELIEAAMRFDGAEGVELVIASSRELGAEIASNLLDVDARDPAALEAAAGAMAEMLNMIGGRFGSEFFDSGAMVLRVPETRIVAADQLRTSVGSAWVTARMSAGDGGYPLLIAARLSAT